MTATFKEQQPTILAEAAGDTRMRVRKRNGRLESVDVNKIVRAVTRCCKGMGDVEPMRVATRTSAA